MWFVGINWFISRPNSGASELNNLCKHLIQNLNAVPSTSSFSSECLSPSMESWFKSFAFLTPSTVPRTFSGRTQNVSGRLILCAVLLSGMRCGKVYVLSQFSWKQNKKLGEAIVWIGVWICFKRFKYCNDPDFSLSIDYLQLGLRALSSLTVLTSLWWQCRRGTSDSG